MTVGNHDQPFDRLVRYMDGLAAVLPVPVVMQTGACGYIPRNATHHAFMPFEQAEEMMRTADAVVGHAGIGTVISARRWGTPLIISPRRHALGEHFNDHQLEICGELVARPRRMVYVAMEVEDIAGQLAVLPKKGELPAGEADDPAAGLKNALRDFLAAI